MQVSFKVHGNVQGVMFRKTFVLGCQKRGLRAGATNNKNNRSEVLCSIEGDKVDVASLKKELLSLEELNSWHAKVETITECDFVPFTDHEVTTDNVLTKNWSDGVQFYF